MLTVRGPDAPGEQIACLTVPALPLSARWARRHVTAALSAWNVPEDALRTAELVVSELASNAVLITATRPCLPDLDGTPRISIVLRLQPDRVVIEVTDNDIRPPVLSDAGPDAENGRGLVIVQAVAKEWGFYTPPSGGKVVFAVVSTQIEAAGNPGHVPDGSK